MNIVMLLILEEEKVLGSYLVIKNLRFINIEEIIGFGYFNICERIIM